MKNLFAPSRLPFLALAFAGISAFVFLAMISPYAKARARLRLLQPQVRATVAAERFLRYSTLEMKEAFDYGLIEEGEDKRAELEKNGQDMDHWRAEAQRALIELRSALTAAENAGNAESSRNDLRMMGSMEENYAQLGRAEQSIRKIAMESGSLHRRQAAIQQELIPLAAAVSSIADQVVEEQVAAMQRRVSRLSGNLDGIVLYSGGELRARAQSMSASASKEVLAGTFARLFTQSFNNFSEFLVTGDEANAARIEKFDEESEVLEQWKEEAENDRGSNSSATLSGVHDLEQSAGLYREYAGRVVGLVRKGQKTRAIHFMQSSIEPLINAPLVQTMNVLTETEEQKLFADSEFISSKLKRAMGLTSGLLLIVLIAAVSGPLLLSKAYLAAVREIAEREKIEAQLLEAIEGAEAASRAKSTFLATMSHEIRTPMNGILGMTELMLDTELTAEQRDSLGLVRVSAESLLAIINDILDFSKIEAGKLELESVPFDLRESLGETIKSLSYRAHQKGLELIYDVQPEIAETLLGDPGRIRQMIINLVGNSIKFTERGEVLVTVEQLSEAAGATSLHFAVRDTGVGIRFEQQQKIFESFSQADGSMARKYGGTGLGLAICSRLAELMGGRIWVESEAGKGATFHFTAKFGLQGAPARPAAPLQPEKLRGLAALIVDDNSTNRRVLHGMLLRWGLRPTAVANGRAALQAIENAKNAGQTFPLILLDGQMPEMDGFTLAEQIQAAFGSVGSTIMMLTSAGQLGDAGRCRELGISAYLVKPVRQSELLRTICRVLDKSAQSVMVPLVTRRTVEEGKSHLRILLAEDNIVNRTLATRLLEKRGMIVLAAEDGRAAVRAFETGHFDAILMDIQMPEMDGFEATAAIREKEQASGGHIPIIALTANAMKGDQERCLSAGMDGYLSKPIRTSELLEVIGKLAGNKEEQGAGKLSKGS